jgi:hypothetical protein
LSVKEKTFAAPDATFDHGETADEHARRESPASPRRAGLVLVVAGILLMLLSGWTPVPSVGAMSWENVSTAPSEGVFPEGSGFVSGGVGDDDLYGEPGENNVIVGGEGDDFIEAKDGERDYTSCGPGDDVASVDGGLDVVASDCETVYGS